MSQSRQASDPQATAGSLAHRSRQRAPADHDPFGPEDPASRLRDRNPLARPGHLEVERAWTQPTRCAFGLTGGSRARAPRLRWDQPPRAPGQLTPSAEGVSASQYSSDLRRISASRVWQLGPASKTWSTAAARAANVAKLRGPSHGGRRVPLGVCTSGECRADSPVGAAARTRTRERAARSGPDESSSAGLSGMVATRATATATAGDGPPVGVPAAHHTV
jgi:hypothetical protein